MTTTYRSAMAVVDLEDAQAELYEHLASDAGGRCTGCGELEPCRRRGELHTMLLRNGFLPRRQPGRTRAGLRRWV